MKYILFLLMIAGCKEHTCPPPVSVITHYDTVKVPQIDTLVVIQRFDSIPTPKRDSSEPYMTWGMTETRPMELFKDGKRRDTIWQDIPVYY